MSRALRIASLLLLVAGAASAQSTEPDLTGVWKRLPPSGEGEPRYFRFAVNAELAATIPDGRPYSGSLLNPPHPDLTLAVSITVMPNQQVLGQGTWADGKTSVNARWEFTLSDADHFAGRCEWLEWKPSGEVTDRGWDEYRFERLPRVGLVTTGPAAEEPFGDPIEDVRPLVGGWAGPGGAWALEAQGKRVRLVPVGHHDGQRIALEVERGVLRGAVEGTGTGAGTAIELALSEDELEGRAQWLSGVAELGDGAAQGWCGLELTRLARLDGGAAEGGEVSQGDTSAPLDGVWKRDDGLFLRLRPEGGHMVGVLSRQDGTAECRVQLEAQDGRWVGTANWNGVEARWELAPTADGLAGRCEWLDAHQGRIVSRGWGARTFKALRRIG